MQHMRDERRARRILGILGLVTGMALLVAPQAQAKDEFERGFKDELGRIAAHEAAYLGHGLLAVLVDAPYAHRQTVVHTPHRRDPYDRYDDRDRDYRRHRDRDLERQHGYYRYPRDRGYHRGWWHPGSHYHVHDVHVHGRSCGHR